MSNPVEYTGIVLDRDRAEATSHARRPILIDAAHLEPRRIGRGTCIHRHHGTPNDLQR
jgi:hypothetical protein